MIKLLPVLIIILVLAGGGLAYFRFKAAQNPLSLVSSSSAAPVEVPKTLPGATTEERVANLETSVNTLVSAVNSIKQNSDKVSTHDLLITNLDNRLKAIEGSITEIKARLSSLEKGSSATSTISETSPSRPPLYIPFGTNGSGSNSSWTSVSNYQISLDPSEYAGYSNMQLEVSFRLPSLVGTGYARLYNSTDRVATSSELSTTSGDFVWMTTSGFTLPSGKKTYQLQLKSSQSQTVEVQSARIKVNY